VTGVDISADAVERAKARYADFASLEFRQGDCAALPFPDASFDAVVSFETIEHIAAQEKFLDEIGRVLRPEGLLILSSPNRPEYSERRGFVNPYHVRELDRAELAALLEPRFPHARWFGQRLSFFSLVWPEESAREGEVFEASEATAELVSPGHARPLYFIVAASRRAEVVAGIAPRLSALADRDEWVYNDYATAFRNEKIQWDRGNTLDGVVAEWQDHFKEAARQRDVFEKQIVELSAQIGRQAERFAAEHARVAQHIQAQQQEIERRAGLRWWLTLPLRRFKWALRPASSDP